MSDATRADGTVRGRAPTLLDVRDLVTEIGSGDQAVRVVDGVSLRIDRGEMVGLVGESGCGKSMTAFSVVRLFPTEAARVAAGQVLMDGRDLLALRERQLRDVRGREIGMVFQDPSTYLDPVMPVGRQVAESLAMHGADEGAQARVHELLELMGFPDPRGTARRYPHQLSGGQRQRVLIAAAIALNPKLLIADEPTTALDVTVQQSILRLLEDLREELGLAVLLITHDLGVIAETCERAYVMYAGRVVETNSVAGLFTQPRHPYTKGLLRSTVSVEAESVELFSLEGRVPDPRDPPPGCRFHPRCPAADARCREIDPRIELRGDTGDACLRSEEEAVRALWVR